MRDRDHDDDRSDHTPANKHGAEESGRVDQKVDGVYKNAAHNKIPFLLTENSKAFL